MCVWASIGRVHTWHIHKPKGDTATQSVYLENKTGNHFSVVTRVWIWYGPCGIDVWWYIDVSMCVHVSKIYCVTFYEHLKMGVISNWRGVVWNQFQLTGECFETSFKQRGSALKLVSSNSGSHARGESSQTPTPVPLLRQRPSYVSGISWQTWSKMIRLCTFS